MMEPELPRLYLETSVISYLASRRSKNLLVAANQQLTHDWWERKRGDFQLFISDTVIEEISAGDPVAAEARLAIVAGIRQLSVDQEALALSKRLIQAHALPRKASTDALYLAVAAVQGMHYLLTLNCRHIANAEMELAIRSTCLLAGYDPPVICTPYTLMGEWEDALE
jgi:hypothetical protein